MAAHRYWRLYITAFDGIYVGAAELEFRTSVGTSLAFSGGTLSASSYYPGYPESQAANGNTSDSWLTNNAAPQWWRYDYGSGNEKDIVELYIAVQLSGWAPKTFRLEYSDDNSSWTDSGIGATVTSWSSPDSKTFTKTITAKVSQVPIETLRGSQTAKAQLDQAAVEALRGGQTAKAQITQGAIETLRNMTPILAQVEQIAVEVVRQNGVETPPGGQTSSADYPSFAQLMPDSTRNYVDDPIADRAVDGNSRARLLSSGLKSEFRLVHLLTASEKASLDSFYSTYRLNLVRLQWQEDGDYFNVYFLQPPTYSVLSNRPGSERKAVEVRLGEY